MNPPDKQIIKAALNTSWGNHQTRTLAQNAPPSEEELKMRWKQHIGSARTIWNKVSENELLTSEGHKKPLVCLIQKHHDITRDEANKQVNRFFEKHMT